MQLVENFDPVSPLHNRKNIENFIDQSLLGDWAIRVEYAKNNSQGQLSWFQWGSTMFAIKSPADVMEAIDNCHANYPAQEIRIHAEKFRPEMRMVYSIFRASESGINNDQACVNIASQAANQEWIQSADESGLAKANSAWRYLAAVGALAGTLLVLEAASS
jgi:ribulose bisphosphate carboxylase small subunit